MARNGGLAEKVSNAITIWGFASSVVINAISQFLESDVARVHAPSLAEWGAALSFIAFGLLILAAVAWAISYIRSKKQEAASQPMSADQSLDIQRAISTGLNTALHLGHSVSAVTTSFSEGRVTYIGGTVEYEGKVTVRTSPKGEKPN